MAHTDQSIDTLISISGTLASIELALVAILVSKASMDHFEALADDIFLLSSLGFLFVVVLGYLAQKRASSNEIVKGCRMDIFCLTRNQRDRRCIDGLCSGVTCVASTVGCAQRTINLGCGCLCTSTIFPDAPLEDILPQTRSNLS